MSLRTANDSTRKVIASLVCVGTVALGVWAVHASDPTPRKTEVQDRSITPRPADTTHAQTMGQRTVKTDSARPAPVDDAAGVREFADAEVRDFFTVEHAIELIDSEPVEVRTSRLVPVLPTPLTTVKLRDGQVLTRGESLTVGDVIVRAILRNDSDRAITLKNFDTGEFFDLLPGETVIIAASTSCSVECNSAHYACCNIIDSTSSCKCRPNAQVHNCQVGGAGASACSISAAN